MQKSPQQLGLVALLVYGLIFMVPISPISIYGYVHSDSNGMVPFVYLVGAFAILFTALTYRKMSEAYPVGGSVFTYVSANLGNGFGFMTGWIILMDYILIPALVYNLSAAWVQDFLPQLPAWAWIISIMLLNTMINCRGIILTTRMSFILLIFQLISVIAFTIYALYFITHLNDAISYSRPFYQAEYFNIHFIGTALSLALLNYLGFDGISTLAEEAKNPKKNIGNAILLVLLLISMIFILQTYVASLAGQYINFNKETAFFDIAYAIGGSPLYALLIIVNIVSIGIASALVTQAASARILNVMARNHVLPAANHLASLHPRFKTPILATCLSGLVAVIFSLALTQESLIALVSWGGLTAYLILNYSLIHHFLFKSANRSRKAWISSFLFPLFGLLFIAFVWVYFPMRTLLSGGIFVLLGVILYWRQSRKKFSFSSSQSIIVP